MPFTIESTIYRYFLWSILILAICADIYFIWMIWSGLSDSPAGFLKFMYLLGILIRLAILTNLILKEGPIKQLILVWGGFMIFSGIAGLLALLLSTDVIQNSQYNENITILIVGLALVIPVNRSIRFTQADDANLSETSGMDDVSIKKIR